MRQPGTTRAPHFDPMRWRLWFAAVGAPAAWILHLFVSSCRSAP